MSKVILFIASMDTKQKEIEYAKKIAINAGCSALIMDTSTRTLLENVADITPKEILEFNNISWNEFEKFDKGDRIETMARSVIIYVKYLYEKGGFDGVMSIGGGQNSKMSSDAMKQLPYGVPKIIVSTLASGKRVFDLYIGNKDILVMHSVIDIAGLNSIANMVINNGVSAMIGMMEYGILLPEGKEQKRIATTMLGITTKNASTVMDALQENGCETIGFHANGVGGMCMEELAKNNYFDLILDLNLHEITCELYGGFCSGAIGRTLTASTQGIPQIVVPGAIDVLDYAVTPETKNAVMDLVEGRQYYFHNSTILHAKIHVLEAYDLASTLAERLNLSTNAVTVILPLNGFCEAGEEGKTLCNKKLDLLFIKVLKDKLDKRIKVIEVDANINDDKFSQVVIEEAKLLLQ